MSRAAAQEGSGSHILVPHPGIERREVPRGILESQSAAGFQLCLDPHQKGGAGLDIPAAGDGALQLCPMRQQFTPGQMWQGQG